MIALPEILSGMAPGLLGMAVAVGGAIWFKVEQSRIAARHQVAPAVNSVISSDDINVTIGDKVIVSASETEAEAKVRAFVSASKAMTDFHKANEYSEIIRAGSFKKAEFLKPGKVRLPQGDITSAWMRTIIREDSKP